MTKPNSNEAANSQTAGAQPSRASANGSAWTTGKLLLRNALLVCAIIEGAKAATCQHLSFDFLTYAILSMSLLACRDMITPNNVSKTPVA